MAAQQQRCETDKREIEGRVRDATRRQLVTEDLQKCGYTAEVMEQKEAAEQVLNACTTDKAAREGQSSVKDRLIETQEQDIATSRKRANDYAADLNAMRERQRELEVEAGKVAGLQELLEKAVTERRATEDLANKLYEERTRAETDLSAARQELARLRAASPVQATLPGPELLRCQESLMQANGMLESLSRERREASARPVAGTQVPAAPVPSPLAPPPRTSAAHCFAVPATFDRLSGQGTEPPDAGGGGGADPAGRGRAGAIGER
ncbi:MAG: hypothetical protein HQL37_06275 [Alphaproteobacteria bacterium]|nr:hypothetical protein [Alphaproteobacteria bacterium]